VKETTTIPSYVLEAFRIRTTLTQTYLQMAKTAVEMSLLSKTNETFI